MRGTLRRNVLLQKLLRPGAWWQSVSDAPARSEMERTGASPRLSPRRPRNNLTCNPLTFFNSPALRRQTRVGQAPFDRTPTSSWRAIAVAPPRTRFKLAMQASTAASDRRLGLQGRDKISLALQAKASPPLDRRANRGRARPQTACTIGVARKISLIASFRHETSLCALRFFLHLARKIEIAVSAQYTDGILEREEKPRSGVRSLRNGSVHVITLFIANSVRRRRACLVACLECVRTADA